MFGSWGAVEIMLMCSLGAGACAFPQQHFISQETMVKTDPIAATAVRRVVELIGMVRVDLSIVNTPALMDSLLAL